MEVDHLDLLTITLSIERFLYFLNGYYNYYFLSLLVNVLPSLYCHHYILFTSLARQMWQKNVVEAIQ